MQKLKLRFNYWKRRILLEFGVCPKCWPEHGTKVHLSDGDKKTLCGRWIFDVGRSPARERRRGTFCKHCETHIEPNDKVSDAPDSAAPNRK